MKERHLNSELLVCYYITVQSIEHTLFLTIIALFSFKLNMARVYFTTGQIKMMTQMCFMFILTHSVTLMLANLCFYSHKNSVLLYNTIMLCCVMLINIKVIKIDPTLLLFRSYRLIFLFFFIYKHYMKQHI